MMALICIVFAVLASSFKSKVRLEAENTALRHQLIILRRKVHSRVRLTNKDRLLFVQLYRWFPSILTSITIIRPETLVRWHRACLDHLVILGEAHLRQILRTYARYYNKIRTHRSLDKDAPAFRSVQRVGAIRSNVILGGLHHHYVRV